VINFTIVSSVVDGNNSQLLGAADMEIVTIGGEKYLFVAAEADGAVSSFHLSATLAPQLVDTLSYSATSGTLAVGQLTVTDVNGVTTLLPSARYDNDVVPYQIGAWGLFLRRSRNPQTGRRSAISPPRKRSLSARTPIFMPPSAGCRGFPAIGCNPVTVSAAK